MKIPGIHHITAIASDPQRNLAFYTSVLGMRLVKLTVNFDDPGTYHFYLGDETGTPGSILTFFPWPHAARGRHGNGQATVVSFAVPSLDGWSARLPEGRLIQRFGGDVLSFTDPDGLQLELVPSGGTGLAGVTLSERGYESTAKLLLETFGYTLSASEGNRYRYISSAGNFVDLLCQPDARRGAMGAGTVHHVAFRAESDEIQNDWRRDLVGLGYNLTPVLDRQYFHSIYFNEPGGVLFEIATDPPGFTTDEAPNQLGTHLKLPPWLESSRPVIEATLPSLRLPTYAG
ncbi:MAG TPA: ring-cleaving dioxygenase [Bryobacteraceae bacterium]|jgi:catechol 2,3-dioxygenase-like lactoylglutathione lyase family enzyme|nr:ring-cleaving dioxygenase [Bryobacteraceae bacterium]